MEKRGNSLFLYRSVSQITRDKFERTMPQAYCCWAYNFSGKEYHVYAKFIMAGQLVSAAPLYAADVPANTPLAPQQVFRYNNHSDPVRSTRKGGGEYCRADCAGSV